MTKKRVVRMSLEEELVQAIDRLGLHTRPFRKFHNMLESCLMFTVWLHNNCGLTPDDVMLQQDGKWTSWNRAPIVPLTERAQLQDLVRMYYSD